nr:uncharacterized protein LOC109164864 [Ipomoea trifida]
MGFHDVEVELESEVSINVVMGSMEERQETRTLLADCNKFLRHIGSPNLLYVLRQENRCTDFLVKYASGKE